MLLLRRAPRTVTFCRHRALLNFSSVAPPPPAAAWLSALPLPAQRYLRLARVERPVGTWLVLLPAWSGLALCGAPGALPPLELFALFGAGAFLMRGAGCTVNDMWDRRFDAAVSRTAARPLASGEVSLGGAAVFLVAQLTGALWCLLQLNGAAGAAGAAVLPLVALYPALKRATHAPQAALGLAMNWGVVMAAAAVRGGAGGGSVEALRHALGGRGGAPADAALRALEALRGGGSGGGAPSVAPSGAFWDLLHHAVVEGAAGGVLPFYLGCAAWTVVYDTLYAHQDREEDAALGLRSTAVWLGDGRAANVAALGALTAAAGALWAAAGAAAGMGAPFFVGAGAATAHVGWQVATARFDDRANLGARFVSNKWAGGLLLAGAVAGRLM
jgi:4-hydroxybenzoate polyprenyltransferase